MPTPASTAAPISAAATDSALRVWAFRLPPGADLKRELAGFAAAHDFEVAFIATCVGSLSAARLRLPTAPGEPERVLSLDEPMEILALSGTLSPEGLHLHIALARRDGQCVGGHLLDGCRVRTTAELVIGEPTALAFHRSPDPASGFHELHIAQRYAQTSPTG